MLKNILRILKRLKDISRMKEMLKIKMKEAVNNNCWKKEIIKLNSLMCYVGVGKMTGQRK